MIKLPAVITKLEAAIAEARKFIKTDRARVDIIRAEMLLRELRKAPVSENYWAHRVAVFLIYSGANEPDYQNGFGPHDVKHLFFKKITGADHSKSKNCSSARTAQIQSWFPYNGNFAQDAKIFENSVVHTHLIEHRNEQLNALEEAITDLENYGLALSRRRKLADVSPEKANNDVQKALDKAKLIAELCTELRRLITSYKQETDKCDLSLFVYQTSQFRTEFLRALKDKTQKLKIHRNSKASVIIFNIVALLSVIGVFFMAINYLRNSLTKRDSSALFFANTRSGERAQSLQLEVIRSLQKLVPGEATDNAAVVTKNPMASGPR